MIASNLEIHFQSNDKYCPGLAYLFFDRHPKGDS